MSGIMFITFFGINTFLLAVIVLTIYTLKTCLKEIQATLSYIAGTDVPSESEEDEISKEIEKRDKEFAERIEKLKGELAMSVVPAHVNGTPAEILHPSIYNLPHDAVREEPEPDFEVSI